MRRSTSPRRTRGRARRAADSSASAAATVTPPATAPSTPSSTKLSRRRFMGLVTAVSVALVADPLRALAQTNRAAQKAAPAAPPRKLTAAAQEEIRKQKGYAAQAVKTIMEFPLPPGTPPSFVFRPLKPRGRR